MKTRLCILTLSLALFGVLATAGHAADSARVLTGELVVTDASANRFRIIGHNGSFTAPSGTQVGALDGHTVQVELSPRGAVTQIVDTPVAIPPITHGWSTARGELVVTDPASRRFTLAGDNQIYVAPASIDIAPYAGRMVEIKLDENGSVTDLQLLASPQHSSYIVPSTPPSCRYRDQVYSAGASVCQAGSQYRCDGSQWQSVGIACQVSDARDAQTIPRLPHPRASASTTWQTASAQM